MQTQQGNTLQSLRAVRIFLATYADRLAGIVHSQKHQQLDDAITDLESHHAEQAGSFTEARSSTERQYQLRRELLQDHMTPIARIAAADLPDSPELKPLRMPRGRPSTERLAGFARGMAETAARYADTFIAGGLPVDFIAQLRAAADAMVAEVDARNQHRARRGAATEALKVKLSQGRKIVDVLDALVKKAIKGDPFILAKWGMVKRVKQSTSSGGNQPESVTDAAVTL